MAECFEDYPLYQELFPEEGRRRKQMIYFCWYFVYVRQQFAYLSDSGDSLVIVQKPGERYTGALRLVLNPAFLIGTVRYVTFSSLMKVLSYARLTAMERRRFYRPEQDWFVHLLCARQKSRGSNALNVFHEMNEGASLFCFTHSARNARLYRLIGFQQMNQITWRRLTVYTMRRQEA